MQIDNTIPLPRLENPFVITETPLGNVRIEILSGSKAVARAGAVVGPLVYRKKKFALEATFYRYVSRGDAWRDGRWDLKHHHAGEGQGGHCSPDMHDRVYTGANVWRYAPATGTATAQYGSATEHEHNAVVDAFHAPVRNYLNTLTSEQLEEFDRRAQHNAIGAAQGRMASVEDKMHTLLREWTWLRDRALAVEAGDEFPEFNDERWWRDNRRSRFQIKVEVRSTIAPSVKTESALESDLKLHFEYMQNEQYTRWRFPLEHWSVSGRVVTIILEAPDDVQARTYVREVVFGDRYEIGRSMSLIAL